MKRVYHSSEERTSEWRRKYQMLRKDGLKGGEAPWSRREKRRRREKKRRSKGFTEQQRIHGAAKDSRRLGTRDEDNRKIGP